MLEVRTKNKTISNGMEIESNTVIATIETELDADNLESLIRFGNVIVCQASGEKPISREPSTQNQPDGSADYLPNPDDLNKLDADEDAKAESEKKSDEDKADSESKPNDRDLSGLEGVGTERVQGILADAGMVTKEDVKAKLEAGFDFQSLDGIGKVAADKIKAWAVS